MTGPPPRWFWLLPALAVAAWWPFDPYWQSDDYLALHYARDLGRALHDFVGPQYGATDVWLFYRPLITLSFWFDQTIGGPFPPFGHWDNVAAHATSTLLVGLVWRRFLPDGLAFAAAVLWTLMASHSGSIAWAVGRVDSHTTVWCLATLWLCLRANERRATGRAAARWPMLLAFAGALASKELAFAVPPLATWLCGASSSGHGLRARLAAGARASWPLWALFAAYVPFRIAVLGGFGGYIAGREQLLAQYELGPMLAGLGHMLLDLGVPLRWIGLPAGSAVPESLWLAAAAAPVAVALAVTGWRRPRVAVAAVLTAAIAFAPISGFLRGADNPHNLRYCYLPAVALVGLLAGAGRACTLAVLLAWAWPLVAVRTAQHVADVQSAQLHRALLREAPAAPAGPMFVAGLPHANAAGTAVQLHFGVDRMLRPPFCTADVPLYAWRPLADLPGAVRLTAPDEPPFALPLGSTWWFADPSALGRAPAPDPLPELVVRGDADGVFDLTTQRLDGLTRDAARALADGTPTFGLTTPGVRPPAFRVTLFTANGYLSCLCLDHARADAADGRIDALRFFAKDEREPLAVGRLSTRVDAFVGDALVVPTTIDLEPAFPTLLEGGAFDFATGTFTPTHRARRMITFRFDRGYPGWVRRAQGQG